MEKTIGRNKNAGYTLVELIVVIMIMSILTAGSVVGFSVYYNARVDSAAQKLVVMLAKTRQESIARSEGSVTMNLYQEAGGDIYTSILYDNGTSIQELEKNKICNSSVKISVKTATSTTYLNFTPSVDPAIVTLATMPFGFKKSTGGLVENYTDIILEGSETKNIIIIKETGRSFVN